ncbi:MULTISPECIES: GNAT family N-acetyltransferase [Methylobacterium]|uniref:N-acetyltransferase domain-containing protein n=1 Tax=Methylobacterium jeotgali TaxID=381630 RepID=A0ABQ4SR22_9HYPH|nr:MULTISPECIES: GNAT family N-acetyltransferase [Methylobacterium]PIU06670.1 MAG: N-acetyltransferase [Methylobacterium sp. CG09_land_8_20_14_0_10_71_15]PIU12070.1 MAG: N-acetyltransferase [Methylobacterium sp. CG08_land_8_20_14_0_20_71_15]GBU19247.1 hypothetical protein AwMethylo_34620 [Methylobacterium sp.]GJE04741.1 hypothetical protein AOPFMNJM_0033 [Methylobacterium jeotgali]
MQSGHVTLEAAESEAFPTFKRQLQEAFAVAIIEEFGSLPNGPVPSDADLDGMMSGPGAVVLHILCDGRRVGGAVVTIDGKTHRNALDLFFIATGALGRGLGLKAWRAIEERYPETRVWQTHTPYFEKRNIHFYVNKCGFSIVEFFGPYHSDPHGPGSNDLPGGGEAFRFEKVMNRAGT